MTYRQPVRTMIVAVSGGVLLAFGAATATAGPGVNPNFPLSPQSESPSHPQPEKSEPDKMAEKAEKLGGGLTTKIIDLGAGLVKCGLNVVAPTVKCD